MRIKTFEAPTMQEALALARTELGEDAVVLNTKHVKANGILGLRNADKVEIMAAVDDAAPAPAKSMPETKSAFQQEMQIAAAEPVAAMGAVAARLYSGVSSPAISSDSDPEVKQLRSELKELTSMVHNLMSMRQDNTQLDKPLMLRLGIDENIARGSLRDLLSIDDPYSLASALAGKMQAFALPPVIDSHQVIAVVGPTGVGKTTTLAKLAARFALEQGKSVALVTADTFRIGAVEQLRTYARIMNIPLEIALSPEEVAAGVEKHKDKDVVLIDTVGRSQRNEEHLNELKSFVDAANPTDTYLVISASLESGIQNEVIEKFSHLSPTKLAITKLDECLHRGCLINLPLSTGLGISCMTDGQNVPKDIDFADAGCIARLVTEVA